jgi:hypothetical protein
MADKKLKQVIVVGMKAVGYTVTDSGVVTDPDLTVDTAIDLTVDIKDFDNVEDFYTVSRLVTRAVRSKITKADDVA